MILKIFDFSKSFVFLVKIYFAFCRSAIAERQKAKYILTRNTKDFEKSKILSITPHDYLNINK